MMGQDEARTGGAAPGTPNRGVSHRFGQPCDARRDTSLELWLEDSGHPSRYSKSRPPEGSTSGTMMLHSRPVSPGPQERWCYFYYGKCSLWIVGKELGQCTECEKVRKNHDYFRHSAYSSPFLPIMFQLIFVKLELDFMCILVCSVHSQRFYYKNFQTFNEVENFF